MDVLWVGHAIMNEMVNSLEVQAAVALTATTALPFLSPALVEKLQGIVSKEPQEWLPLIQNAPIYRMCCWSYSLSGLVCFARIDLLERGSDVFPW
jgi:hypothetical protein